MSKINFHDRKIGLLEARIYIIGLNLGIMKPSLTAEERKSYNLLKNANNLVQSERKFLINELEFRIGLHKRAEKVAYCHKHGHKEIKNSLHISARYNASGLGYLRSSAICSRCGENYDRSLSLAERKSFNDDMMT